MGKKLNPYIADHNKDRRCVNMLCLLLNILYYLMLIALLGFLIIPHTSAFYRVKLFLPFTLHLNKHEIILARGESERIYVNGINKRATYKTMDFKVADVTLNGNVLARRCGKTFVYVKVEGKVFKCRVYVVDLNKTTLKIGIGESYSLKVKGINRRAVWSSSDKRVATVSRTGKVVAVSKGSTVIKAVVKGKTISCKVTVR